MEAKIEEARDKEIKAYIGFNWLIIAFNVSGMSIASPCKSGVWFGY